MFASVTYALNSQSQHLEDLTLTGTADISGTGNGQANTLMGNTGDNRLDGAFGNDRIIGGQGDDTIIGNAGNDVVSGWAGSDTFVYADGFGVDTITDFDVANANETIDLSAVSNITDFADLAANHLSSNGAGDAVITDGANSITLTNVAAASLTSDEFDFV